MSSPKQAIQKYRPSLTSSQISYILQLAKSENPISPDSRSIIATLAPFLAKIENDAMEPAYSTDPKLSIEEGLGINTDMSETKGISKAGYNAECWAKYKDFPESCSLQEIDAAKEHAYINDLMSASEEQDYEAEIREIETKLREGV